MLSAQCDKLRELATRYDELQAGAVKAVTMPSNMGPILRDAAHTIWELRCRLVDAEDRVRKSGELCKLCEREADNAKLRELVRWMYDRMDESCAVQHPYAPAPISYDRLMQAAARAHELGVEVE
jgi:hypothetical protein